MTPYEVVQEVMQSFLRVELDVVGEIAEYDYVTRRQMREFDRRMERINLLFDVSRELRRAIR